MIEETIHRGLEGVVVDTSAISLVDGDNGVLSYRGVPVDDLVDATLDRSETVDVRQGPDWDDIPVPAIEPPF